MSDKWKTGHSYHMGVDVRGVLSKRPADFRRFAKSCTEDGRPMTPQAVREALFDHLSKGHEVIPMGDCDNWDWKDGCQGHPSGSASAADTLVHDVTTAEAQP